ncbi:MAG TPA: hypothetical protein VJZ77_18615 [Blastocatellia bacterium]|nr:hypothetical protein [Blastocatellia bacterium]
MEIFVYLGVLINAALIAAGGVVVIAIWYGMKALVKMADSMRRMAEAAERMEETIRRNAEPRV